ncbi:retrovirus-related Pol polyprotein from transposon 17.6 [Trichonephila clavipes]|nr:retrovirus-related Pol polyprotein from transposon 17.6 [Trichonephila clavipes]
MRQSVPVPEMASTPLVEALPQIFRRVFPREIQADREALLMSILTTELLQKLGTYCPLRVPFRLKNAFYCFSMLMAELPQWHEKFNLSYFDNVVVFSEGWDIPIDHMEGILELNTHLAVRSAEFELTQDGVEYCSHVVGLGKQSPAQLKVRAIINFSISRYRTQVKVLGYDRQYIPMFSRDFGGPSKNRTFPSSEKVLSRGRSCGECSEEVGEKGFLESGPPTFRVDSSGKDMWKTGFEGPDWRQKAKTRSAYGFGSGSVNVAVSRVAAVEDVDVKRFACVDDMETAGIEEEVFGTG